MFRCKWCSGKFVSVARVMRRQRSSNVINRGDVLSNVERQYSECWLQLEQNSTCITTFVLRLCYFMLVWWWFDVWWGLGWLILRYWWDLGDFDEIRVILTRILMRFGWFWWDLGDLMRYGWSLCGCWGREMGVFSRFHPISYQGDTEMRIT